MASRLLLAQRKGQLARARVDYKKKSTKVKQKCLTRDLAQKERKVRANRAERKKRESARRKVTA